MDKCDENGNFTPMGVNDHQMCCVKFFVTPKAAIFNNGGHLAYES